MAQLAQEAESRNRQRRPAVGWQVSGTETEQQDVVDGDIYMGELPPVNVAPNVDAVELLVEQNNEHQNIGENTASNDNYHGAFGVMEQVELDEVTESEIDSPVRERNNQEMKKKGKGTVKPITTSQSTKNRKKMVPKEHDAIELSENHPSYIFDFSSDDDNDMTPVFTYDDISDDFATENTAMDAEIASSVAPCNSTGNEAFITTRGTRTRKSTRQQAKSNRVTYSNAPSRKGSRKRVNRMEPQV